MDKTEVRMYRRQTFRVRDSSGCVIHVVADDAVEAIDRCIGWGIASRSAVLSVEKSDEILLPLVMEDTNAK